MSWIGDKAAATANVLKDLLMQTPAAKLYRQGLPNVLDALLNTREEEWRSKVQAMPKPFDASQEAINRDVEAAMAFWNPAGMVGTVKAIKGGATHDSMGRALDRSGLSDIDRLQRDIRSLVDEFTAQVMEQKDAPSTVLKGAKMWAADAGLSEGAIRRALYSKWNASENKRLKDLAPFMLSGGGP